MLEEVWVAEHHHKHGLDIFVFDYEPTEEEVIKLIEAEGSSFEPNEDYEYLDINGPVPVQNKKK